LRDEANGSFSGAFINSRLTTAYVFSGILITSLVIFRGSFGAEMLRKWRFRSYHVITVIVEGRTPSEKSG